MKIKDYPIEEQMRMGKACNYFGWGSFEAWIEVMAEDEVIERDSEDDDFYTPEEAEELINDILTNPEDKVGFAKRMAVNPDLVTAEKMIERIRAKVRK